MGFYEHLETFAGKQVRPWEPGDILRDLSTTIYRIRLEYDEEGTWSEKFKRYLANPAASQSTGLVVGKWTNDIFDDPGPAIEAVEALVAARDRLPHLQVLFFGDITSEESEVSWIVNTDLTPLLVAYPQLLHLGIRGGGQLRLGPLRHANLQSLIIQTGGLDAAVVQQVGQADLPALEHLELYLGVEDYGGTTTLADLAPLLRGDRFPALRYLGLRDSERTDEIAQALAQAPILERITVLDLSLGTLSDTGARALLESPAVRRLSRLDIHHHWCSDAIVAQLHNLGIEVDTRERQADEDEDWRFVAISE